MIDDVTANRRRYRHPEDMTLKEECSGPAFGVGVSVIDGKGGIPGTN
jgi:hypothetical protein